MQIADTHGQQESGRILAGVSICHIRCDKPATFEVLDFTHTSGGLRLPGNWCNSPLLGQATTRHVACALPMLEGLLFIWTLLFVSSVSH